MGVIELPITVLVIDNVAHDLVKLALDEALSKLRPVQVLIFTDAPSRIPSSGADYRPFHERSYAAVSQVLWYEVPKFLSPDASHFLWIQWDSGVLNQSLWNPNFLSCDYVGAPFPIEPGTHYANLGYANGKNVGSGGFSLRSKRLAQRLATDPGTYPLTTLFEDDAICRIYRAPLERAGFRFAELSLASQFSFDTGPEVVVGTTFGYHGCINWLWAFSREEREKRFALAPPIINGQHRFQDLLNYHVIAPEFKPGSWIKFGLVYGPPSLYVL